MENRGKGVQKEGGERKWDRFGNRLLEKKRQNGGESLWGRKKEEQKSKTQALVQQQVHGI